ncbi:TatD family hydrolase [Flocculibacter collagenilyticus]|uniref:TatD family hydrolase n=1 Tax=Flocculibacter collagenilyticus TaxID=2744479 RepID=UPI0018F44588|nr:TatD family hydrolase [Flocculibacter collagenilyticus]
MLIDVGVNLTSGQFDKDRQDVINRAFQQRVSAMIITATDIEECENALAMAQQMPDYLACTAGVHPHYAKDVDADYLAKLKQYLTQPNVVAVGECGLDFNRDFSPRPQQEQVFIEQIILAGEQCMPLFMHERDAHQRFLALYREHAVANQQGVVHCFTGTVDEARNYLDMGLYLGITGWLCDERRGQDLREALKYIPLERLLLETDAPYLLPRDLTPKPKSRRNEPAYLMHVARAVASLKNIALEEVLQYAWQNNIKLFNLTNTALAEVQSEPTTFTQNFTEIINSEHSSTS